MSLIFAVQNFLFTKYHWNQLNYKITDDMYCFSTTLSCSCIFNLIKIWRKLAFWLNHATEEFMNHIGQEQMYSKHLLSQTGPEMNGGIRLWQNAACTFPCVVVDGLIVIGNPTIRILLFYLNVLYSVDWPIKCSVLHRLRALPQTPGIPNIALLHSV